MCSGEDRARGGHPRSWRRWLLLPIGLLVGIAGFVWLGGLEAIARGQLRAHLVGRVDCPDLHAGLTRVSLRDGRLWEEGRPDHLLLRAEDAEADVDLLHLRVPRILVRGGVLSFRERIDSGFVVRTGRSFPRIELERTTVLLRGEEVLRAAEAVLTRDEDRVYGFQGTDLVHRGLRVDGVWLRLREKDGGADVQKAVVHLLGGMVKGELQVARDGSFQGRFSGEGLDLEALTLLLGSPSRTRFAGHLSGGVRVQGSPYDLGAFRAEGDARVDGLAIRDEPLLLELLGLLGGIRPDESPFDRGEGRFEIEGGDLRIVDAEVLGGRWGLRGEGVVHLAEREVDLEIVLVSLGSRLDDLPLVGGRIKAVSRALRERAARAHVTGSFDRIRVVPVALEDLGERMSAFVRRLLTGD
jgi:hypothetical protein